MHVAWLSIPMRRFANASSFVRRVASVSLKTARQRWNFDSCSACITSSASRHLSRLSNTRSVFTGCVPKTIITSIHFIVLSPPGTGPARFAPLKFTRHDISDQQSFRTRLADYFMFLVRSISASRFLISSSLLYARLTDVGEGYAAHAFFGQATKCEVAHTSLPNPL